MEGHMKNDTIAGKDMTQHALQCFERGAATWWRMYQTINGWQEVTTWKEFKFIVITFFITYTCSYDYEIMQLPNTGGTLSVLSNVSM